MESERKHRKFFELAKKLSQKSDYHHKIGAVIVRKNKVIGLGFNKPKKTHPQSPNAFKTTHAEFDALWSCSKQDLKGAIIYVYREHKNGCVASAKPCKDCDTLLKYSGIKRVYYTENGHFKQMDLY